MSFRGGQCLGFASAVLVVLGLAVVAPGPYPEGYRVDRHTGAPSPDPWRQVADACALGDAAAALFRLESLPASPGSPVLAGLCALLRAELQPLAGDELQLGDAGEAPIERLFRSVATAGTEALDARAAMLQPTLAGAETPAPAVLIELADEFGRRGRQRAQWRWLQRAFARHPEAEAATDGLLALSLAHGRLQLALQVVGAQRADRSQDPGFQRRRAELGAWLGDAALEADALERLVARAPGLDDSARLIELYAHLGTPERALPHALALADTAGALAAAEDAARSALANGFVDEGLQVLQRAAARAGDPAPWLRRLADFALQDLQVERAAQELGALAQLAPDSDTAALESLYRRTDQPGRLADLLQRRLVREPDDAALWNEVIALRFALGQRAVAQELAAQREIALDDPERFLANLPPELRAQAATVRRQALAVTLDSAADGAVVGEVLERLRPFLASPEFRAMAEALLTRHPHDPRAKQLRAELVDLHRTPVAAALAAAALSATYPDDRQLVELWIERAAWADLPEQQASARQRLFELAPDDRANRLELAELLAFAGDRRTAIGHWRALAVADGVTSPAVPRLIDALYAEGDEAGAFEWLQRLASDPAATTAQRLAAAGELFFRNSYDRASVLFGAVLAADPAEPTALLRLGQIHAWTNDPRRARTYFERRLAASTADEAVVRFYLGETLWATGENQLAAAQQRLSLQQLAGDADADFTQRSMVATMLARLGRNQEAATAYRELVAQSPRDVDMVLDYADVLVAERDFARAEELLRHAKALAPDHQRLLRLAGEMATRRHDHEAADRAYTRSLELYGAEAGVCSDQGQARLASGDWQGALQSFERWLALQQDSTAARRATHEVRDLLATTLVGDGRLLRVGDDRTKEATLGGVLPLDDRTWLQGRIGVGHYSGRTTATPRGEAEADTGIVDLALGWRFAGADRVAVGVTAAPGADGDLPAGLFAALHLQADEPFATLEFQAVLHEVWTEPAAAVGLGGRRSGITAQGHAELGESLWLGGGLGFDLLSIDPDTAAATSDHRWNGELSVGMRLYDGDVAVASRFQPRLVPAGPQSPFLAAPPEQTREWLCNGWISWQAVRLDDDDLSNLLPLAQNDDHLIAALRLDHHLATGFGCSVAAYSGFDLRQGDTIWGVEATATWRPGEQAEFTLSGNHGASLGRSDGGDVDELRLQAVLRW